MGVIARQSIKGAIANYLGVAIGFFVTFLVLPKYLTQEQIGLTRVMVDAAMLFTSFAQLGTNASILRFFPYFKDGKDNHGIFGWSVLIPLIGFTLFAAAFLIFREPLLNIYSEKSPLLVDYFYLLPMLTFFALYMTVFETNASVLMRITVPKLVREVGVRLFNLVAYLLLGFKVLGLTTFVWLFCGSYLLAMLLNLFYLCSLGHISFRIDRKFIDRGKLKEIGLYTLLMTATGIAGNIPLFNSIFLGAKTGLMLTGVYAIIINIANVVEVSYRSLGAISRPVIATAVKEEQWGEVNLMGKKVSLLQFLVSLMVFYLIWINIDTLFDLIPKGESFKIGKYAFFILGLAKVVNSSFSVGTDILNYSRRYIISLPFSIILTASAIVLNIFLIDSMGINGAAYATLFSYLLYFLILHAFLWLHLRVCVFSRGHFKMAVLIAAMLMMNEAWGLWLSPHLPLSVIPAAALKTLVLGGLAAAAVLLWRISPTVNDIVKKTFHRQ